MFKNSHVSPVLMILALSAGGCRTASQQGQAHESVPACSIIYDAGSSMTRLFVYQQTAAGWLLHPGPATDALADPIRGNRGKTMADTDSVIDALLEALTDLRSDGPLDKNGKPRWLAFDWQRQCRVESAAVYATAGMRIAEQQDAGASDLLWNKLNERLGATLGVPVTTRSLSEYEEGLYAWMALSESQPDANFGIAEMGGASLQVAFPCGTCEGARQVRLKDRTVQVFSRSFLGWGQDEAWNRFGHVAACQRGAGAADRGWRMNDCESGMAGFADAAAEVRRNLEEADGLRWYLTDAFRYMRSSDIENYCQKGLDSGFEPESSCFRAIYLQTVIKTLALPPDSAKSEVNWTLGAVVCAATQCLETR